MRVSSQALDDSTYSTTIDAVGRAEDLILGEKSFIQYTDAALQRILVRRLNWLLRRGRRAAAAANTGRSSSPTSPYNLLLHALAHEKERLAERIRASRKIFGDFCSCASLRGCASVCDCASEFYYSDEPEPAGLSSGAGAPLDLETLLRLTRRFVEGEHTLYLRTSAAWDNCERCPPTTLAGSLRGAPPPTSSCFPVNKPGLWRGGAAFAPPQKPTTTEGDRWSPQRLMQLAWQEPTHIAEFVFSDPLRDLRSEEEADFFEGLVFDVAEDHRHSGDGGRPEDPEGGPEVCPPEEVDSAVPVETGISAMPTRNLASVSGGRCAASGKCSAGVGTSLAECLSNFPPPGTPGHHADDAAGRADPRIRKTSFLKGFAKIEQALRSNKVVSASAGTFEKRGSPDGARHQQGQSRFAGRAGTGGVVDQHQTLTTSQDQQQTVSLEVFFDGWRFRMVDPTGPPLHRVGSVDGALWRVGVFGQNPEVLFSEVFSEPRGRRGASTSSTGRGDSRTSSAAADGGADGVPYHLTQGPLVPWSRLFLTQRPAASEDMVDWVVENTAAGEKFREYFELLAAPPPSVATESQSGAEGSSGSRVRPSSDDEQVVSAFAPDVSVLRREVVKIIRTLFHAVVGLAKIVLQSAVEKAGQCAQSLVAFVRSGGGSKEPPEKPAVPLNESPPLKETVAPQLRGFYPYDLSRVRILQQDLWNLQNWSAEEIAQKSSGRRSPVSKEEKQPPSTTRSDSGSTRLPSSDSGPLAASSSSRLSPPTSPEIPPALAAAGPPLQEPRPSLDSPPPRTSLWGGFFCFLAGSSYACHEPRDPSPVALREEISASSEDLFGGGIGLRSPRIPAEQGEEGTDGGLVRRVVNLDQDLDEEGQDLADERYQTVEGGRSGGGEQAREGARGGPARLRWDPMSPGSTPFRRNFGVLSPGVDADERVASEDSIDLLQSLESVAELLREVPGLTDQDRRDRFSKGRVRDSDRLQKAMGALQWELLHFGSSPPPRESGTTPPTGEGPAPTPMCKRFWSAMEIWDGFLAQEVF